MSSQTGLTRMVGPFAYTNCDWGLNINFFYRLYINYHKSSLKLLILSDLTHDVYLLI